jgi:predicted transposase/invertase (TIGR01784 family)
MQKSSLKEPTGKLVEIEGIEYLLVDGKLYRYADMTLDKGFKIVLGRPGSEEILKNLLNRLLGIRIAVLEYRSNEYPGMTEDDRESRFDIYCKYEDGGSFVIEMQNWQQKYFNKRAVYYSSLAVQNQAVEEYHRQTRDLGGKWNYDFRPLYVVSFLNFNNWTFEGCEKRSNEYIATYRYCDVETGLQLNDGTNLVFIDLNRFDKEINDCESIEELWLYSIKNMYRQNTCPAEVAGTEVEALFRQAELAKMTKEQRISLETSIMSRNDMLNSMHETIEAAKEEAILKGRAEGLAEGLAQGVLSGKEQERRDIVKKLLSAGMLLETIAEALDLDLEQVQDYASN